MKNKLFIAIVLITLSCGLSTSAYKEGAFLYDMHCSSCHGHEAEGLGSWYPSLTDTAYLNASRSQIPSWIRYGINRDAGSRFHGRFNQADMPENQILQAADISNILNYLNDRYWKMKPFTMEEVEGSLRRSRSL